MLNIKSYLIMILVTGVILMSDSDVQAGKTISQFSLQFVLAKSSSIIGRWDLVWRPTKNMIMYRVFQKDGQAIKYTALLDDNGKPTGAGQTRIANYKINSDGTIQIFNELREYCVLKSKNEMQCYTDGQSLEDLGFYRKR